MRLNLRKYLVANNDNFISLFNSRPSTHYKVFKIPKRTVGFRVIAQPTPEVKHIQKQLVDILSPHILIHDAAMAYIKGVSIKTNAYKHSKSDFLLKTDFDNFFNSITPEMLFESLKLQEIKISPSDKNVLKEFLFWNRTKKEHGKLILSVGAPSSPFISNLIMCSFDKRIEQYCSQKEIIYTRYADDLTFSSNKKGILFTLLKDLRVILNDEFNKNITLNESKTVFSSKAHNRHVTGVTITNNNKLSIGREKKRYISALIHKFKNDKLSIDDIQHLKGLLSFASHIEGEFIERMNIKYGRTTVTSIIKYQFGEDNEK
jgi:RNA-directed DNA polymerase